MPVKSWPIFKSEENTGSICPALVGISIFPSCTFFFFYYNKGKNQNKLHIYFSNSNQEVMFKDLYKLVILKWVKWLNLTPQMSRCALLSFHHLGKCTRQWQSIIHADAQNLNHRGICAWAHVLHVRLLMASAEKAKCLTRSQKTKLWVWGTVREHYNFLSAAVTRAGWD